MKIVIGSMNKAKIQAVKEVFPEAVIVTEDADSGVSAQPFSDEETRQGAINRALSCLDTQDATFGIGLEGGVMFIGNQLYLCNWGALAFSDQLYTASGARIALPHEITEQLIQGRELGDVMDEFAKRKQVRQQEGAVGIFTSERISRRSMFRHVMELLRGQWEFTKEKKESKYRTRR
ncbi:MULTISPECIES: DUF84 family protein [Virgibacillus]|uniref:inosine/xanthosine triphosphatase n=1 Tax=Virgibacillus pantothenticus TaxID=1473 RepID=A0A0L0QQF0_VIRPA|nr:MULTISPECIES: DUF84 family protein [Virgibacillus]API90878.1 inosine/xanthosine triphosphatase [Virgibacillus sp. 6R]KNE20822.1 NTPase [Virgibacillus pantothenticus]MBS7429329.1 DUF84 family protein [Virgibacillus sp. 19R1-5]MBU8568940.1 DUF84 family protein [Virgibacillus pantothenticus]MBU8602975.1 DUF84 family protein [Virgibacillus pantothenticus]